MISGSNEQLQQGLEYTLLKPDCHSWLIPKMQSGRDDTLEEMKEAVTKVIDMLTQEDFHGAFQKLLEQHNKCIAVGGDYFKGTRFSCMYCE